MEIYANQDVNVAIKLTNNGNQVIMPYLVAELSSGTVAIVEEAIGESLAPGVTTTININFTRANEGYTEWPAGSYDLSVILEDSITQSVVNSYTQSGALVINATPVVDVEIISVTLTVI